MSKNKQEDAIRALDDMLKNLKRPKLIPYQDIINFYEQIEEFYDSRMEEVEAILFEEIDNEEKFDKLKKISELLEINIF